MDKKEFAMKFLYIATTLAGLAYSALSDYNQKKQIEQIVEQEVEKRLENKK
jgi:hypothetical protein